MTKRKRLKPLKSVIDARMGPDKPEPKDPLSGLKRKHPTPWSVSLYCDWWEVKDKHNGRICFTKSRALARAIARMGAT
jgi:hypothetical protein